LFAQLNLLAGQKIKIMQGKGEAVLAAALDEKLPDGCVRIAAGHPATAALGGMFGALTLEKIAIGQAA
jgi:NADH-quinone oxidoreductase subunit G